MDRLTHGSDKTPLPPPGHAHTHISTAEAATLRREKAPAPPPSYRLERGEPGLRAWGLARRSPRGRVLPGPGATARTVQQRPLKCAGWAAAAAED